MIVSAEDKVRTTGMAIGATTRIIDQAMPQMPDMVPKFEYGKWAPLYLIAHVAFENGLKALILQVEGVRVSGHALRKLFRRLKGKAPKKAKILEDAFTDITNFYTIDLNDWEDCRSLDVYLGKFANWQLYQTFRYWAPEGRNLEWIPLFIHREMLARIHRKR